MSQSLCITYKQFSYSQVQQISVDNDASSSSSQQPTLGEIILLTPGAFCTPRSVIKNMTSQARPKAEEVQEEMKKLEEKGLGEFVSFSRKESAFYKVIPDDESQETVTSIVGDKWDKYKRQFLLVDTKYVTATQHDRLLNLASEKDRLLQYGIVFRQS